MTATVFRCAGLGLLLVLAAACSNVGGSAGPAATTPATDGPSAAATSTTNTSGATSDIGPATTRALPVYYVARTDAGPRLYREFHSVSTADPVSDAVRELLAAPTGTDPDYHSNWPAGTGLASPVRHSGGVFTVNLTGPVNTALIGAELAEFTVQQLVYTVQGAAQSTDPVRITVDSGPIAELWGHVATDKPIGRADPYATRSLVQIDNPADGARVGRTFTVSGEAAAFEANVPWEVLRGGSVVRSGHTMTGDGTRFSAYEFTLTLEPGEYTVRVLQDDPSGGEGGPPVDDTKVVQVTG